MVQIEFPLRNGSRTLRTELLSGYRWSALDKTLLFGSSSWFSLIIALIKTFLLIHPILYQNKWLGAVCITAYLYLGTVPSSCYPWHLRPAGLGHVNPTTASAWPVLPALPCGERSKHHVTRTSEARPRDWWAERAFAPGTNPTLACALGRRPLYERPDTG